MRFGSSFTESECGGLSLILTTKLLFDDTLDIYKARLVARDEN